MHEESHYTNANTGSRDKAECNQLTLQIGKYEGVSVWLEQQKNRLQQKRLESKLKSNKFLCVWSGIPGEPICRRQKVFAFGLAIPKMKKTEILN